jgi:uncharacterized protein (TIGR03435 family)
MELRETDFRRIEYMKTFLALTLFAFGSAAAFAQAPSKKLEFEVASIRPSAPSAEQNRVDAGLHLDGAQARIAAFTLKDYLGMAYKLRGYQVTGPDWIGTDRFDINAKLPAGAKADDISEMLQTLLAERFKVKFHMEKKEMPVYALVMGKPPLKLKEVPASAADDSGPAVNVAATGSAAGVSVDLGHGSSYSFANSKFEARKLNMDAVAQNLEMYVDRPILNMTELKGNYDLTLQVTPEDYQAMLIRAGMHAGIVFPPQVVRLAEGNSASLMDAVQEAGLKMDSRRLPVDLLVVDSALKSPTDN